MIRAGLFLYDRLGGRMTLPRSFSTRLAGTPYGAGLKPRFTRGFVLSVKAAIDTGGASVVNGCSVVSGPSTCAQCATTAHGP